MQQKTTRVICDSHLPDEADHDTPLYAIFEDGDWYFVDEEIWADLIFQAENDQDA
jgi:nitric oxide reductase activation protein